MVFIFAFVLVSVVHTFKELTMLLLHFSGAFQLWYFCVSLVCFQLQLLSGSHKETRDVCEMAHERAWTEQTWRLLGQWLEDCKSRE